MNKTRVIDKDYGYKRIAKEIGKMKGSVVNIGVLSDAPTYPTDEGGANLADIAAFQEYGTRNIPARPFMAQTFDNNRNKTNAFIAQLKDKVLEGRLDVQAALTTLGVFYQSKTRETITKGDFAPNKASTIRALARKIRVGKRAQDRSNDGAGVQNEEFNAGVQGKKPLVNTGHLRRNINFEVKIK